MNVANMLSHDPPPRRRSDIMNSETPQEAHRAHQYPTRHSTHSTNPMHDMQQYSTPQGSPIYTLTPQSTADGYGMSPTKAGPKGVTFKQLYDGDLRNKARLPMTVQIWPHDSTDGIVSTVRNFFGLYDEAFGGVSFEDHQGNMLIASYENFVSGMTVYVRASWQDLPNVSGLIETYEKPEQAPHLDEGFRMPPPQSTHMAYQNLPISRPASRLARRQSTSPQLKGFQRAPSMQKSRSRAPVRRESQDNAFQSRLEELNHESFKGYNSSDGDAASATSSFRARNEQLASAEISEANIVEGGRRQKAKFESSELPLFVPPQVPAPHSISSISPQRRSNVNEIASPYAHPSQATFGWNQPSASPQHALYGINGFPNIAAKAPMPNHGHRLRDRVSNPAISTHFRGGIAGRASGFGILPTPDPTIASTISDEDVALQLMRLGDPANLSHGRTSASTMDDAFSGHADFASSATSDGQVESDDDQDSSNCHVTTKTSNMGSKRPASAAISEMSGDEEYRNNVPSAKRPKLALPKSSSEQVRPMGPSKKTAKNTRPRNLGQPKRPKMQHSATAPKVPVSPASLPPQSRKGSSASLMGPPQLPFADDQDLSSKPRCQRCRKSKKGCDRQRPCQRCKDAGIGIEGCVSEDEGNGRKGRFGRHMGVSVHQDTISVPPGIETEEAAGLLDDVHSGSDKSKKRKR